MLGACHRPGETPKTSAEPPPAAAARKGPDTRAVIVAFGDSLTAGFGVDPGQSYPDYLQKQLDRKGLAYRVVNAGLSGETTTGALARLPAILAEKPAIVVVEFGGNDGLRGLPVKTTRANLDKIVDTIQKSGAKVLLAGMTLPPNYGPEYIGEFQNIYPELAAKHKAMLIPFLLQGVGGNPDLMQNDGIHPTAEGNRIVGDLVFQFIQKMIK
jgi:acyl-CoA thioesterase-1